MHASAQVLGLHKETTESSSSIQSVAGRSPDGKYASLAKQLHLGKKSAGSRGFPKLCLQLGLFRAWISSMSCLVTLQISWDLALQPGFV